ncbi:sugar transferase [Ramlibacter sp.]|uniref:sugar transferase n=1 Tax=Ramlibacter sp. TaxID=1917967 RepID=UPI003D0D4A58
MQRFFDIVFSTLALLSLAPLLVPVALLLRFTGEGEIFFLQDRIGRGGRVFKLFKFATMLKNSPSSGTVTVKGDPRILPMGHFLRRTKINELPQLLNILLGDMSVIGPRPLTQQTFACYTPEVQRAITSVRPGLSGVGSIVFRNEEEILSGAAGSFDYYDRVIAPYKGELERWYVKHEGLYVYFASIMLTIIAVLVPDTRLTWKLLRGLPEPPDALKTVLHWS